MLMRAMCVKVGGRVKSVEADKRVETMRRDCRGLTERQSDSQSSSGRGCLGLNCNSRLPRRK